MPRSRPKELMPFLWQLSLTTLATTMVVTSGTAQTLIPFPTPKPAGVLASPGIDYTPTASIPFPTAKPKAPQGNTYVSVTSRTAAPSASSVGGLRSFFSAYGRKDANGALRAAKALRHPLDRQIAQWMIATGSGRGFSYQTLASHAQGLSNWPGQTAMSFAREQALVKARRANGAVARALPATPSTDDGKILQVRSLIASGQRGQAASKLRTYWVKHNFSAAQEKSILSQFNSLLTSNDHLNRVNRLLYDERATAATRLLPRLSGADQALANARIAVIRKQKNAGTLLSRLPASAKRKASYSFALAQHYRRADKWLEAGKVMAAAPTNQAHLGDPGEWWIERRMISRKVLEAGHPRLAYKIASQAQPSRLVHKIDVQFHAGWYALRFLNDPNTALRHFTSIAQMSKRSLSQSRAYYWAGRAHLARGDKSRARSSFEAAARYRTTYYGQLSLRVLGHNSVSLPQLPSTANSVNSFNRNLFVQVIQRLNQAGQSGRTGIFYRHLAQTMKDPAHVTLLAKMADDRGLHSLSLQIGKLAVSNGVNVPRLAFPLGAISSKAGITPERKALAYAIARQESAFNVGAVSHANAKGLMQLLPTTAKRTARSIGVPYSEAKLTRDGAYNARLGSAFLGQLIQQFGNSYILAFAGYNAGPRRSSEWIQRFGDPRKNAVDAVDWVEFIPFSETRNYVQRVMENFQIYRHRLENAPLTIARDLNRGQPS